MTGCFLESKWPLGVGSAHSAVKARTTEFAAHQSLVGYGFPKINKGNCDLDGLTRCPGARHEIARAFGCLENYTSIF